jgi:hypothetical protein
MSRTWRVLALVLVSAVAGAVDATARDWSDTFIADPPSYWAYHRYRVLVDTDNDTTTGCQVSVAGQTFDGIEKVVSIYIDVWGYFGGANPARGSTLSAKRKLTNPFPPVVAVWISGCVSGSAFDDTPTQVDPGSWPVGLKNGTSFDDGNGGTAQADVIEGYVTKALLGGGPAWRLYYWANAPQAGTDVLSTLGTDNQNAIILQDNTDPVPSLAAWGRVAFAAALGLLTVMLLRRRLPVGALVALFAAVALGTAAIAWAATITCDGDPADWEGSRAVAAFDGTCDQDTSPWYFDESEDIVAAYATTDATKVYFRIDVVDVFKETQLCGGGYE